MPFRCVIYGVEQTSLFLNGDTFSRRDYVFIYTGTVLAATVKGRYKRVWVSETPGLTEAAFFDLYNDPREAKPLMLPMFPAKGMFSLMKVRHEMMMAKYPNTPEARGFPLTGIEDARPETKAAGELRVDPSLLPFDPCEMIKQLKGWEGDEYGHVED